MSGLPAHSVSFDPVSPPKQKARILERLELGFFLRISFGVGRIHNIWVEASLLFLHSLIIGANCRVSHPTHKVAILQQNVHFMKLSAVPNRYNGPAYLSEAIG